MKLTPVVSKALQTSALLHYGQFRKSKPLPYIIHPVAVAMIVSEYTTDENTVAAALLHDVIEDVKGYGYNDLKRDFGTKIANLVKEVSEEKDPKNEKTLGPKTWLLRKEKYIIQMKTASQKALLISVADKIHNLMSVLEGYQEQGRKIWDVFNAPADKKLWFYDEVYKIAKKKLKSPIISRYKKILKQAHALKQ